MIKLSLENLHEHLKNKFDIKLQPETKQLYMITHINNAEYPLFIRILDQSNLIQFILFFPINIKAGRTNDVARLLHLINKEIDAPGFCLDEESGYVFYRSLIPVVDKKVEPVLIENVVGSTQLICKSFSDIINNVANGLLDFRTVFNRAKDEKKKNALA